ncbi:unnamed protein product, partial [Rhizoctonia solani]
ERTGRPRKRQWFVIIALFAAFAPAFVSLVARCPRVLLQIGPKLAGCNLWMQVRWHPKQVWALFFFSNRIPVPFFLWSFSTAPRRHEMTADITPQIPPNNMPNLYYPKNALILLTTTRQKCLHTSPRSSLSLYTANSCPAQRPLVPRLPSVLPTASDQTQSPN